MPIVRSLLTPEDFWQESYGNIYRAICALADAEESVDPVTVYEKLSSHGAQPETLRHVMDAILSVPIVAHVGTYAGVVVDKSRRRQLLQYSAQVAEMAYDEKREINNVLADTYDGMRRIMEGQRPQLIAISDAAHDYATWLESRMERPDELEGLPTSLHDLDELLWGLPNELVVVAGVTSSGKTALGLQIARHNGKAGNGVLFYSLEMGVKALMHRMACSESRVDSERIRRGRASEDEMIRHYRALDVLSKMPFYFSYTANPSASQIRADVARYKMLHDIRLVVVDYVQLMAMAGERWQALEDTASALRATAVEEDVCVLCMSQLNRRYADRDTGRPQVSDLRGSGGIEQAAGVVLLVHRPEMTYLNRGQPVPFDVENRVELILAKNRNGVGRVGLNTFYFEEETGTFGDLKDR